MNLLKNRVLLLFSIFLIISSCNNSKMQFNKNISSDNVYFDVVQKNIFIDDLYPSSLNEKLSFFFNKNIKTNGLDGIAIFYFKNYSKEEITIDNGKKVILKISLLIEIKKSSNNFKKILEYNLEEFGQIEGNFSLSEYDNLIEDVEVSLINRLINNL